MSSDIIQQRLGSVDSDQESSRQGAGVANAATLTNPEQRAPDDLKEWEKSHTEYGLTTRWLTDKTHSDSASLGMTSPQQVRWVTDGNVEEYYDTYGEAVFEVPSTFTAFKNEWDPYLGVVDTVGGQFGYGINAKALEKAMRILTGGGRYKASRYSVLACGKHPWLLTGPEGTLLCTPSPIEDKPDDIDPGTVISLSKDVSVLEENPDVITGIERIFEATQYTAIEYDDCYSGLGNSSWTHDFVVEDENDDQGKISLHSDEVVEFGATTQSKEEICAAAEDKFNLEDVSPPRFEIGSSYDCGLALGFELTEQDLNNSNETLHGIRTLLYTSGRHNLEYRTKRLEISNS